MAMHPLTRALLGLACILIGLYVVADAVYFLFDQLTLSLDSYTVQCLAPCHRVVLYCCAVRL